jgi:hypothetical protein
MNIVARRWRVSVLGFLLLTVLSACLVSGEVYDPGVVYAPAGYTYGGWGPRYHVGPPRGGEYQPQRPPPRAYRPAPQARQIPTIPTHPHGSSRRPN